MRRETAQLVRDVCMSRRYSVDVGGPCRGGLYFVEGAVLGFCEGVWPRTVMMMFLLLPRPTVLVRIHPGRGAARVAAVVVAAAATIIFVAVA